MPIHDGLDNPRSDPRDDIFDRWPFSKRLADTIARFDTTNGAAVFGIFGRWGYGKSTVLNYLKHALAETYAKDVVLFEFNPWFFNGQEELLTAFLSGLAARLEQTLDKPTADAGKLLSKFSGIFGMIPLVGAGASKFAEQIGKEMSDESLDNRRKRAFDIMRSAGRTVVVVIDDLDRLDREEILVMLKLIRLNANVPRVVYVLAFDDTMVAAAIGAKYGSGPELGRQFLEKIVQYPFTLPAVGRERLASFVVSQAERACIDAGVELNAQAWAAMRRVVEDCLLRRLTTPRQAIRYVNALEFALPMLKGMVNPFEQMIVEGLRVLFPELYAMLRDDIHLYSTPSASQALLNIHQEKLGEYCRRVMVGSSADDVAAGREAILTLFNDKARFKSIANRFLFNRYFMYAISEDELVDDDIESALERTASDHDLAAALREKYEARPSRLIDAIYMLPFELSADGTEVGKLTVSREHIDRLAVAAAGCSDLWLPGEPSLDNVSGPFADAKASGAVKRVEKLFEILFASLGSAYQSERTEVYARLIEQARPPQWGIRLFVKSSLILKEDQDERIREAVAKQLKEMAVRNARAILRNYERISQRDVDLTLLAMWQASNPSEQRSWLEAHLQEAPEHAALVAQFVERLKRDKKPADLVSDAILREALKQTG